MTNDKAPLVVHTAEPQAQRKAATRRAQGEAIGKALRKQFDDILTEPVPDDLIALLDQLELREGQP